MNTDGIDRLLAGMARIRSVADEMVTANNGIVAQTQEHPELVEASLGILRQNTLLAERNIREEIGENHQLFLCTAAAGYFALIQLQLDDLERIRTLHNKGEGTILS